MASRGIGQVMIERYLQEKRYPFYRAGDGECLTLIASQAGQFQVYMRARSSAPNVVKFRARNELRFPHAQRSRILEWVNGWNDQDPWVTASVRESVDRSQLRIVGNSTFFVVKNSELPVFRRFAELSFGSARELFETLNHEMTLPSPSQLYRWFEMEA